MDILDNKVKNKNKIKIKKYYKYLDKTIYIIVGMSVLLLAVLIFIWNYYIPSRKNLAIKVNFIDNRDPTSVNPPSTTDQDLYLKSVGPGNYQTQSDPSGITSPLTGMGNYDRAQLKQFCSMTDTSSAINLPGDFKYQQCDIGLVCTPDILQEGPICLAGLDQQCNNLSDCVPGADACISGKCVLVDNDNKINIPCDNDTDCQLNDFEDQINNHICYKLPGQTKGFCKYNLYPFDGGCRIESDCPSIANHQIKCVNNNFRNTLMQGTIICATGGDCDGTTGEGLSLQFDDKFNMEYLQGNDGTFMVHILSASNIDEELKDFINQSQPYVISTDNINLTTNTVWLNRLEFFTGYDDWSTQSVYISFGDIPGPEEFLANSNDVYGICLDLLPVGSPSNYKLANITIPGVSNTKNSTTGNKIIKNSRLGKGKLGSFCLNNVDSDSNLGCGTTTYLNRTFDLECGYNYPYEEIFLDNLYYGLSPSSFDLEYIGSCMIKNTLKNRPCNNGNNGCIDPYICLPILNPINNQTNNYCVTPMRIQICSNSICPEGYKCKNDTTLDLPFCLSNVNNIGSVDTDCFGGEGITTGGSFDIFVYNINLDKYMKLNLNKIISDNLDSSVNLNNVTLKLSKKYQGVDKYSEMGITEKTILPERILIYGENQVLILNIQNNKYNLEKRTRIYPSTDNTIHSMDLDEDGNLIVIQKRTSEELREISLLVDSVLEDISNNMILKPNNKTDWPQFYNFRNLFKYECFFYSENGTYNTPVTAEFRALTNSFIITYPEIATPTANRRAYPLGTSEKLYLVINSNKLAFNNTIYNTLGIDGSLYNSKATRTENQPKMLNYYLPTDFLTDSNISKNGENNFVTPLVYKNKGSVIDPDFEYGYTMIENGDRLLLENSLCIYSISDLSETNFSPTSINVPSKTYLYPEKIQPNFYINNSNQIVDYNNYIVYLHNDFLTSEGGVPIYNNIPTYDQNFGFESIDNCISQDTSRANSGTCITVYDDMVNYNITFININDMGENVEFFNVNKIIGVSTLAAKMAVKNGINSGITYNFEASVGVSFDFYKEGTNKYILIKSVQEGLSGFHNYVQKISYDMSFAPNNDFNLNDTYYNNFDISAGTTYENFYQSSYVIDNGNTITNNVQFNYSNQLVAPNPKSLYFDSSQKTNLISDVEENLFNADTNAISIYSTFKNNTFIEESGYVSNEILGINSQNIFSNKAPPVSSYSNFNSFNYNVSNEKIEVNYDGFDFLKNTDTSFISMGNSISTAYTTTNNCLYNNILSTDSTFITLRDNDIIDIFLNNPSSEIVLQKSGSSILNYYVSDTTSGVSSVLFSADYVSQKINTGGLNAFSLYQKSGWYSEEGANKADDPFSYNTSYPFASENVGVQNMMESTFTEINRAVIAIDEYNVYVDENGDVKEFLVIKLNAPLDTTDEYIKHIMEYNDGKGWKIWYNNFTPINYYFNSDLYAYSHRDSVFIASPVGFNNDYLTVMDGSAIWSACKGTCRVLPPGIGRTSYNKLVFNDGDNFNIFNAHDEYFMKKSETDTDIDSKMKVNGSYELSTTIQIPLVDYSLVNSERNTPITVSNISDFSADTLYKETIIDVTGYYNYLYTKPVIDDASGLTEYYNGHYLADTFTGSGNDSSYYFFYSMNLGTYPATTNLNNITTIATYGPTGTTVNAPANSFSGQGDSIAKLLKLPYIYIINSLEQVIEQGSGTAYQSVNQNFVPTKVLPKKIRYFDITYFPFSRAKFPSKIVAYAYNTGPYNIINNSASKDFPVNPNDTFLYFKRKYTTPAMLDDPFAIVNDGYTYMHYDSLAQNPGGVLNIFGNNKTPYAYSTGIDNIVVKNIITSERPSFFDNSVSIGLFNSRAPANSFKLESIDYLNIYQPIIYHFDSSTGKSLYKINHVIDGKFDLFFASIRENNKANTYNFIAALEMRPRYSATFSPPAKFKNYSNILYMINNLFLSSIPRQINNFQYLNIKILPDYIVSNLYYINYNQDKTTYFKGLGLIKLTLNSSPIFTNTTDDIGEFNLINYKEIRIPEWFTERFVSRLNSIPRVNAIISPIRQGNIFDNMNYYVYLNYNNIEDLGTENNNDQLLFMTTDIDESTVLENRGVPYTKSLSLGNIDLNLLLRTIKMEPYNKFLFTLNYFCI